MNAVLELNRRGALLGLGVAGLAAACAPSRLTASTLELPNGPELEAKHGGRLGFYAARGDRAVAWRADERFTYCSTFKLFLAAAALERVDKGLERLDRPVPVAKSDMVFHAPVTGPAVGGALSIERLCQAVVEVSDNPAANLLVHELGGLETWRAWWPTIGDTVTRVDRLEPELNRPDPVRDTTTPTQTVRNLRTVLLGDRLSPLSRERLEGWLLASPTGPARLKAGAPAGARVAHKTGTFDTVGFSNDIGMFRLRSGEPMLVAAYYAGRPSATPAERDAVIADAARAAVIVLHG